MIFRLILGAVLSYLLGSLNFGIILSRRFQKEDVRTHGSGNAGSTNMLRNYGKLPAVATILGDMAKVAVAILLVRLLVGNELYAQQTIFIKSFAGLFCVLGHIFPCFFRFKGGKGVATCGGMVFMIDWRIALILLAVFIVAVLITKWVSLGSILMAILYPVLMGLFYKSVPITLISVVFAAIVLVAQLRFCSRVKKETAEQCSGFISLRSFDLTGTKTSGANINSFRRAVYNSLNFLNVGFPGSVGPSV